MATVSSSTVMVKKHRKGLRRLGIWFTEEGNMIEV